MYDLAVAERLRQCPTLEGRLAAYWPPLGPRIDSINRPPTTPLDMGADPTEALTAAVREDHQAAALAVDGSLGPGVAPWRGAGLELGDGNVTGWRRWVEARLVEAGWHDMTEPWQLALGMLGYRTVLGGVTASGDLVNARYRVYRVGRRGAKSSSLMRIVVADSLAAARPSPGDTGLYVILSAKREQAQDRLRMCREILDVCKVDYHPTSIELRLPHNNFIRVYTATIGGAVSGTLIGAVLDEVALWADARGKNPADQIFAALVPSIATVRLAQVHIASAPWSSRDPHATFYEHANRPGWMRVHFATWIGNPSVTEDDCRELAINDAEFMRAYAAIPVDSDTDWLFPPALLYRALREHVGPVIARAGGADWAFRRNSSAAAIAYLRNQYLPDSVMRARGQSLGGTISLEETKVWTPNPNEYLQPSLVFADAGTMGLRHEIDAYIADTHYVESAREGLKGIALIDAPQQPKVHFLEVQRLFLEDAISLGARATDDPLVQQLSQVTATREMGGHVSIELPTLKDGSHGDEAVATVLALYRASTMRGTMGRAMGGRLTRDYTLRGGKRLTDDNQWRQEWQ